MSFEWTGCMWVIYDEAAWYHHRLAHHRPETQAASAMHATYNVRRKARRRKS